MPQVYTPGLTATARVRHRVRRLLPLSGEVLVQAGQSVAAHDIVARTELPGSVTPVNAARALSIPPAELPQCLLKHAGAFVSAGEILARSRGIFGWFPAECRASTSGTIESVSEITGQLILRGQPRSVELCAYLTGHVVEVVPGQGVVIEGDVTLVQGIFGVGGEAFGPITLACNKPDEDLSEDHIRQELRGAVAIGGARVTAGALARAVEAGVTAIVTGGIDDADLRDFLGYDLGVATTGSERPGLTLILTEGFGDIAMAQRTFALLASRAGCAAAVNGATQIRAGVQRPEILVPWSSDTGAGSRDQSEKNGSAALESGVLQIGVAARIIRDPYFGMIGTVTALPPEPRLLDSGSRARVLEVETADGRRLIVPRANVELLEG